MTQPPPDWHRGPGQPGSGPPYPPGMGTPPMMPPPVSPSEAYEGRKALVALTWFLTGLGIVLALALLLWPYGKDCGLELTFYLGASGLTAVAGAAGAIASWHCRRGLAHWLSLLVVVWAAMVFAGQVLPRVGYTKTERSWLCP